MKKIYILFYSIIVLSLISCSNQSAEKDESVQTTPASTPPATPAVTTKKDNDEVREKDTARTEISIGQQGGSVKTKTGTGVSLDKNGVKVGSKDIKIDIKKDTNQ